MWLGLVSWIGARQGPPCSLWECTSAICICYPSHHTGTAQLVTISSTSLSVAWFTAARKQQFPSISGMQKKGGIIIILQVSRSSPHQDYVMFFPSPFISLSKQNAFQCRKSRWGKELWYNTFFLVTTSKKFIISLYKFSYEEWNYGSSILQTVSQSSSNWGVDQEGRSSDWSFSHG